MSLPYTILNVSYFAYPFPETSTVILVGGICINTELGEKEKADKWQRICRPRGRAVLACFLQDRANVNPRFSVRVVAPDFTFNCLPGKIEYGVPECP